MRVPLTSSPRTPGSPPRIARRVTARAASGLLLLALVGGCGDSTTEPDPAPAAPAVVLGEEATLEIMTWNLEWFPKVGDLTVGLVQQIVDTLDVDLIALQEIADTTAFRTLIDSLDGYNGIYSPDTYGDSYQKTGILYREACIQVGDHHPILAGDDYAFPRPPMRFAVTAQKQGQTFDFVLIVLHLKAGGGGADYQRRREAAAQLKAYLDARIEIGAEKDYIVAGDWNDQIDDPRSLNAFTVFLDSEDYHFLTAPLAGSRDDASYPSFDALIDHILVSADALAEWNGGSVHTQRMEQIDARYPTLVSDHRPVMAKFPVFTRAAPVVH